MAETETNPEATISERPGPIGSFTGDVLKLVSGTTIAQLLGLAASPLLTRLFAPEAFGLLAVFSSLTSIVGVLVCLRYERAILLPEDNREAANLLAVSLLSAALVTATTILLLRMLHAPLLRWLDAAELAPYLWLAPPMVFINGVFLALNFWNTRTKHFGRLSVARVTSSLLTTTAKVGSGLAGYATAGAFIGATVFGQGIATAVLGIQISLSDRKFLGGAINFQGMLDGVRRYRKFPLVDIWGAFLNNVSWQVPVFMLAYFFSQTEVGFYSFALRLIYLPMSLIGAALGQVFFQRASEARHDSRKLGHTTKMLFQRLMAICLLPTLLLGLIGSEAFNLIFGARWTEAGAYAQILSIWMLFWFISSPLSTIFTVLERQGSLLIIHIAIFGSRLASLAIGGLRDDVRLALWLFAITGAIVYGALVFWNLRLAGVSSTIVVKTLVRYSLYALPAALAVFVAKLFNAAPVLLVSLAAAALLVYYFAVMKNERPWSTI